MGEDSKKQSVWSQILMAVAIALLAGGTSPWWWNEIVGSRGQDAPAPQVIEATPAAPSAPQVPQAPQNQDQTHLQQALDDTTAIQAIYERASRDRSMGCPDVRRSVETIRVYTASGLPVPESYRYTVRYPREVADPTVADYATDRIERIKRSRAGCFPS